MFIDPPYYAGDAAKLSQAELVVIDEAAAIPLPLVRALLGPYLVFMASTINGYEGTGRSLRSLSISSMGGSRFNPNILMDSYLKICTKNL